MLKLNTNYTKSIKNQQPAAAPICIYALASSHDSETRARDLGRAAERGVSQIERWKSEDVFYYNVNVCVRQPPVWMIRS
jgi:hypothetical protein